MRTPLIVAAVFVALVVFFLIVFMRGGMPPHP
jgi:hypothetical protein